MKYFNRKTFNSLLLMTLLSCSNKDVKAQTYSSVDFMNYVGISQDAIPNNSGMIKIGSAYNEDGNTFGNVTIYLIHKDGGVDWVKETFTRFPKATYGSQPPYTAANRLLDQDQADQIQFAKWAFFIDKQYLEPFTEETDGGDVTTWFTKEDVPIEVILYQQLEGETQWLEIERMSFPTDKDYIDSDWKVNFRKDKESTYN